MIPSERCHATSHTQTTSKYSQVQEHAPIQHWQSTMTKQLKLSTECRYYKSQGIAIYSNRGVQHVTPYTWIIASYYVTCSLTYVHTWCAILQIEGEFEMTRHLLHQITYILTVSSHQSCLAHYTIPDCPHSKEAEDNSGVYVCSSYNHVAHPNHSVLHALVKSTSCVL